MPQLQPPPIDPRTYDQLVHQVEQDAQHYTALTVDIQEGALQAAVLSEDVYQTGTGKPYTFQYESDGIMITESMVAGLVIGDGTPRGQAALTRLLNLKRAGSVTRVSIRRWSAPPEPSMDAGKMLTRIFARLATIAVDRLNRVPDKHFMRFLDLIGVDMTPPQPARVPLTFHLAEGSTQAVRVPAGTPVAAPADDSGLQEAIFETEQPLIIVPTRLAFIYVKGGWFEGQTDNSLYYNMIHLATGEERIHDTIPARLEDRQVIAYLGFEQALPNRMTNIYFDVGEAQIDQYIQLSWWYSEGGKQLPLTVRDHTNGLTKSGIVSFLGPSVMKPAQRFDRTAYWIFVKLESSSDPKLPIINHILLNTTWASQTITVREEKMGSSNGQKDQSFETTLKPVLTMPQVEVFEVDYPTPTEAQAVINAEGEDAITPEPDESGYWVRWHQTPDFYASSGQDRHFVIDHLSGVVRFGDGVRGRVPLPGRNNVRISYRSGGGTVGNRAPETITELKTAIPYIDRVTNRIPASGGANAESLDQLRQRGPTLLRHQDRAVVAQDYEDLAYIASSQVAKSRALIAEGIIPDSDGDRIDAGLVRVIIAMQTAADPPTPSAGLINHVREFLRARCDPTIQLEVKAPVWMPFDVQADVVPQTLETSGDLAMRLEVALRAFLHPVTGGSNGEGWDFGSLPAQSDIYAVIQSVEGVSYVQALTAERAFDQINPDVMPDSLIRPGTIVVRLVSAIQ
ncbi:MAG: putative baseplate assembly protein [Anaerolineae bacterium]|nr:putative baseplate assembly protein [Anaerolineae bacterium]